MNATNTSPLTINVKGEILKLTRQFLGNTQAKTTQGQNELKAYLKGHTHFYYLGERKAVRQKYFYKK